MPMTGPGLNNKRKVDVRMNLTSNVRVGVDDTSHIFHIEVGDLNHVYNAQPKYHEISPSQKRMA
jgi:hypothetical protein